MSYQNLACFGMCFYMSGKINPNQLELNTFRINFFTTYDGEIRSSEITVAIREGSLVELVEVEHEA